jgi:hypothetical protein
MKLITGLVLTSVLALTGCGGGGGGGDTLVASNPVGYIGSIGGIVDNPPEKSRDITTGYIAMSSYGLPATAEDNIGYQSIIIFDLGGVQRRISGNYIASQSTVGTIDISSGGGSAFGSVFFDFSNYVGLDVKKDTAGITHIYVMDQDTTSRIRITKLNATTTKIEEQVSLDPVKIPLNTPMNIAADKNGLVYIADTSKVVRISLKNDATHVAPNAVVTTAPFTVPLTLTSAFDVDVDGSGNIYVADTDAHKVRLFDKSGKPIDVTFPHIFYQPIRVAVTDSGDLNVLDDTPDPQFSNMFFTMGAYFMKRAK